MVSLSNKYKRVPCGDIKIDRSSRQRRVIDTSSIRESIRLRGVINPVIVTYDLWLVAGERRLTASIEVGHADIPVRFLGELSPIEQKIMELEENLHREDLPWRDEVAAFASIHELYCQQSSDWNQERTADALGVSATALSQYIRIARSLADPRLADAPGMKAALNILARVNDRAVADVISTILETGGSVVQDAPAIRSDPGASPVLPIAAPAIVPADESILQADFLSWAPAYTGPKFNLIHCDFPYGINVFSGAWSGKNTFGGVYNDSPDIYWALIECLGANLDRLMAHSGHIVFWFSPEQNRYGETMRALEKHLSSIEFQTFPLIWHKTDNAGIAPDPRRQPRRVYETALLGSREDRPLLRMVSNAYGAPTDKAFHAHTKPVPVLNHFLSMFVDEHTRLLDPTCGSGSSLRSAESLGAKHVLGLELDSDSCAAARTALRQFRTLRSTRV